MIEQTSARPFTDRHDAACASAVDGRHRRVVSEDERASLVRAFTAWCGDPLTAEDLAQETVFEAWRSTRVPDDPEGWRPWLFGVARNVLLRWRRAEAKHRSRVVAAPETDAHLMLAADSWNLDDLLARSDIVELLDAALARIPAASRQALILRYVDELPQKEIAARLGIGEKALEGKLHRGKTAIKRTMMTEQPDLMALLDLMPTGGEWVQTRIWCGACGKQRLEGRWGEDGSLWLDCPSCDMPPVNGWRSTVIRSFMAGPDGVGLRDRFRARSFRAAMHATDESSHAFARDGIYTIGICPWCGGETRIFHKEVPMISPAHEVGSRCTQCGAIAGYGWLPGPTGSHPQAQAWFRRHERHRMLPPTLVERLGRPTIVLQWESLTDSERLVAFRDQETLVYQGDFLVERPTGVGR
ncbi:MAG: RNA polymerase sigma factor [Thermomicrobiales bacterium]